jgi:soluble lytic murein transglycosylase-like protein
MQIMPDTGRWLAGKLDLDSYDEAVLLLPLCQYCARLLVSEFFDRQVWGDLQCAVAAYHSGQGG